MNPTDRPLWDFAVSLYGKPGVSDACLSLQDEGGLDVPLLLYAAWVGNYGSKLTTPDVDEIAQLIRAWRNDVVVPLRVLRRRLKEGPAPAPDERTEALRNTIKKAELAAERIELDVLEASGYHVAAPGGGTPLSNMMTVALHCAHGGSRQRIAALIQTVAEAVDP